ncbi:hypothetical protein COC47_20055, partial [Bacillus cereus]|uniref:RNA-directed DNA polymerase n=1 Tax=Bacillus cereus TaxID=1396 RepID=UPI000BFCF429
MSEQQSIAKCIIEKGFFSRDIPSEITSTILSEKMNNIDISDARLINRSRNKKSKLVEYSIPKKDNFRRICAIPHPLHYLILAEIIEDNWSELNTYFNKSEISLSSPVLSGNSIEPKKKMSEKNNIRIAKLSLNKYILCLDINRYYPSIYTHSISWALHTKEVAKANPYNDDLLGNKLDKAIRNMQDGQTLGIPIGPMSSWIIQEIIGTSLDEEFKNQMGYSVEGYRYTDDMEYYFKTFEEANKALTIMNKVLKSYELDFNVTKTKINKIPLFLEPEWTFYFKKYKFRNAKNKPELSSKMQGVDLKEYFNQMFKYKNETEDKGIMKYALTILRNVIIKKENWAIFESLLLQTALVESSTIPLIFETIETYKYRGYPINLEKISEFINCIIKEHIELRNDYEVFWALSLANKFEISIDEEVTKSLLKYENSIINILVLILESKNLLSGVLEFSYYKTLINDNNLYGENWFLLYECCKNGWLDKDEEILRNDIFFKQLLDNDITFICPNFSYIRESVKNSIISLCKEKYTEMAAPENNIITIFNDILQMYSFELDTILRDEIINVLEADSLLDLGLREENVPRPEDETE